MKKKSAKHSLLERNILHGHQLRDLFLFGKTEVMLFRSYAISSYFNEVLLNQTKRQFRLMLKYAAYITFVLFLETTVRIPDSTIHDIKYSFILIIPIICAYLSTLFPLKHNTYVFMSSILCICFPIIILWSRRMAFRSDHGLLTPIIILIICMFIFSPLNLSICICSSAIIVAIYTVLKIIHTSVIDDSDSKHKHEHQRIEIPYFDIYKRLSSSKSLAQVEAGVIQSANQYDSRIFKPNRLIEQIITVTLLLLPICIVGVYLRFANILKQRFAFLKLGKSVEARNQCKSALKHQVHWIEAIMPSCIREEYQQFRQRKLYPNKDMWVFNKTYQNVSILFADIVGFTNMSSNKTALQVVTMLNNLFNRFDDLCSLTKCEKIGTLGDCYYCVCGCPIPQFDHAKCCIEMGLGMCRIIKVFNYDYNESVSMRVGIHTGRVNAAIIGIKRFRFDVYSYDVIIASELESTGRAGRVHVSQTTFDLTKNLYNFSKGEPLIIKKEEKRGIAGMELIKTTLDTYYVDPRSSLLREKHEKFGNTLIDNLFYTSKPIQRKRLVKKTSNDTSLTHRKVSSKASPSSPQPPPTPTSINRIESSSCMASTAITSSSTLFESYHDNAGHLSSSSSEFSSSSKSSSASSSSPSASSSSFSTNSSSSSIFSPSISPKTSSLLAYRHSRESMSKSSLKTIATYLSQNPDIYQDIFPSKWSNIQWKCLGQTVGRHYESVIKIFTRDINLVYNLKTDSEKQYELFRLPPLQPLLLKFYDHETEWHYNSCLSEYISSIYIDSPKVSAIGDVFINMILMLFLIANCFICYQQIKLTWRTLTIYIACLLIYLFLCACLLFTATTYNVFIKSSLLKRYYNLLVNTYIRELCIGIISVMPTILLCIFLYTVNDINALIDRRSYISALSFHCILFHAIHISSITIFRILCILFTLILLIITTTFIYASQSDIDICSNTTRFIHDIAYDTYRFIYLIELFACTFLVIEVTRQNEINNRLCFYVSRESEIVSDEAELAVNEAKELLYNIIPKYVLKEIQLHRRFNRRINYPKTTTTTTRIKRRRGSILSSSESLDSDAAGTGFGTRVGVGTSPSPMTSIHYAVTITNAAVSFATISNFFSKYYREDYKDGVNALKLLNNIICRFDELLNSDEMRCVEKIKTINDCYMIASGLNKEEIKSSSSSSSSSDKHLITLLNYCHLMIDELDKFNDSYIIGGDNFSIKIGYNIGTLTAGIIGTSKPMYDIWGDTVNVASRMYSTGVAGAIQVPENVTIRLKGSFNFTYRDVVFVKGKGLMKTFLCKRLNELENIENGGRKNK
uniref:adenylate cyclase n=1 Tax=Trichobilharzia regenti TaxID=157069 RepID=A0AA85J6Q0_TRIRE|nr:unnamed protein product [Trichobilharzia regenti]